MPGPKLQLADPALAARIDELYAREPDGRSKTRLLAMKLVAHGQHTSGAVADLCGISRGRLFIWLKTFQDEGLDALLQRDQPGPVTGTCRGVPAKVLAALAAKLVTHDFANAEQARRWLKKEHGIARPYTTVWTWLKKCGGVLRIPRPSHSKKAPGADLEFKAQLSARLAALALPMGSAVKVWVMDEARFGLHTALRRVWTLRGLRPVVTKQIKYQWEYLYGALSVIGGEAHFAHVPGVNLAWDASYLENLVATAPTATHVLIRDQAGFHLRDGDARLPAQVRIIDLPPYSPELNPCEQVWDILKDDLANRVFQKLSVLRAGMQATLKRFWEDAQVVLNLIGRPWLGDQLNALPKSHLSL
jgi:transposase